MRGRGSAAGCYRRRLLSLAAAVCAGCFALLTCKPPEFLPPLPEPTGDPLTLSPLQPELTAGMSFTFTAAGGTPPYTYVVIGSGSITTAGKYTAPAYPTTDTVRVTDNGGEIAATSVIVHPSQLWVVPADVTIPAQTSITFYGNGGTPPYTYSKSSGVGSINASTGVFVSSIGGTAQVKVTDAAAKSVTTNVTVSPPLDPLVISPASAILETQVDLQFNASGGNGPYAFSLISGSVGSVTSDGLYSSGTTPGSATIRVTDNESITADSSVTVSPPPPPVTIAPTSATVPPLSTVAFTANGGTSPYSFSLDPPSPGGGTLDGSGSSRTYTAPGTGGSVTLSVTDSKGRTASAPILVTGALGITPSSTTIQIEGTVNLLVTGGTAPYGSWAVESGPGEVVPQSSNTATYTHWGPSGDVVVSVTDAATIKAFCYITVTADPLLISPTSITIQTDTMITFTASGGSSYNFSKISGVGSINSSTGEYASPVEGTALVRVTDNYGRTQDASVTVNPPPLDLNPSSITIQAGSSVTFTGAGGTPPYTFSMVSGVGSINATSGLYTSSSVGSAVVRVTDSKARTDTASVTVEAPPAPPLNLSPVLVYVQTGSDQTFTASGGTTPYAWSVVEGAAGGSINSSGVYTAPASVPGSPTTYTVRVTDNAAQHLDAVVRVYTPLSMSPKPASVDAGTQVEFSVAGGVPPFTFSLPTDQGTLAAVDGDTVRYTAPGTMVSETIRVTDNIGKFVDWSFTVVDPAKWNPKTTVDANKAGINASMALDTSGAPQIVYYETVGKDLNIARWIGSWSISTVDATANVVKYPSLVLDGSGNARVAWSESGNLYYKAWDGSAWSPRETVVPSGVGQFLSLALDGTGKPGIAYYDSAVGDLKFLAWSGSEWTWPVPVVDETDNVGQYASLAFDGSDRPRIAYFDATAGSLKYAEWDGAEWDISTVDNSGSVGQYASLKLTSGGAPCIAYYAYGSKDLKYTWRPLSTWVDASGDVGAETVASGGDVGQYASLALDPTDAHPLIAFYDLTNGNLKYAEWNATASLWVVGTVDGSANNVGQYLTLGIDPIGKMKIAYHDVTGVDLLFIQEQ